MLLQHVAQSKSVIDSSLLYSLVLDAAFLTKDLHVKTTTGELVS